MHKIFKSHAGDLQNFSSRTTKSQLLNPGYKTITGNNNQQWLHIGLQKGIDSFTIPCQFKSLYGVLLVQHKGIFEI